MTYAYDLNRLVAALQEAAGAARTLMRNHPDDLEPWLWHRADLVVSESAEMVAAMAAHCREVAP